MPRIALIAGAGVVGIGDSSKAADVAADIYEHTVSVKTLVSRVSEYQALGELDLFDVRRISRHEIP